MQQGTQRERLLNEWLGLHCRSQQLLHSHGLQFGAALPFWLHQYEGKHCPTYLSCSILLSVFRFSSWTWLRMHTIGRSISHASGKVPSASAEVALL